MPPPLRAAPARSSPRSRARAGPLGPLQLSSGLELVGDPARALGPGRVVEPLRGGVVGGRLPLEVGGAALARDREARLDQRPADAATAAARVDVEVVHQDRL